MAYTTDLITVLKSLFDVEKPSFSEGTMWPELNRVFQTYEQLDPREQIHRRICAKFQHDQQSSDPGSFHRELCELLLEPPLPDPERNEIGGRNARGTSANPASSSQTAEAPQTPLHGPVPPPKGPTPPPRSPTPPPGEPGPPQDTRTKPFWHYLFPCFAPPDPTPTT